jgi:cytochrome c oxidase cbb3-type subunit 3
MSDFTSTFWSLWVAGLTLVSIVACGVLLLSLSKRRAPSDGETTGHAWDEDLEEYNNPLPRWWVWLFWITIIFAFGYLALYPGLGRFPGYLKWTSRGQYQAEVAKADRDYGPIYQKFAAIDVATLSTNPEARAVGEKLFLNYCAQCHASDARGGKGFPNLTDNDWLYGGDPDTIQKTILDGRHGTMPAWGPILGDAGVKQAANYVRSLSGLTYDPALAQKGKTIFGTYCVACHGAEGKGNMALGAPNLTDSIWLYGSSEATLIETIGKGRGGTMPAHRDFLGEPRVHVLAAYVYGLSHPAKVAAKP